VTDRGAVNARLEAVITLRVRRPGGAEQVVEAVIDTGYTGSLTLPAGVVAALNLTRRSGGQAVLADGSKRRFDTFAADVFWGGSWVGVVASVIGDESLLGMSLLAGRGLWVEVVPGGVVEVRLRDTPAAPPGLPPAPTGDSPSAPT